MSGSQVVRFSRLAFISITWIFTICLLIQVLIAGFALFMNWQYWIHHAAFARFFFFLPLLMAVLSYFAQLHRQTLWRCIGLFGMVIGLFFTAAISARVSILGALHPVLALVLFWHCMQLIRTFKLKRDVKNKMIGTGN
jgi:hypothetical protein